MPKKLDSEKMNATGDTGCDFCPSCLTCWLSVCKEDDYTQARKEYLLMKGGNPWPKDTITEPMT